MDRAYTDETLENLPKNGVKNLAIVCPAFCKRLFRNLEEISEGKRRVFFFLHRWRKLHYVLVLTTRR